MSDERMTHEMFLDKAVDLVEHRSDPLSVVICIIADEEKHGVVINGEISYMNVVIRNVFDECPAFETLVLEILVDRMRHNIASATEDE